MRGLLSLHRGLYTLGKRQARKAGIVGVRCESCATLSNSKVRPKIRLRLGSSELRLFVAERIVCSYSPVFVAVSNRQLFFPSNVDALVTT